MLCARLLLSCPTLWDTMDCSPPDSSVHGTLQARIVEGAAISSSGGLPDPGADQGAFLTRGWAPTSWVSRQAQWRGCRFLLGGLPDPGLSPTSWACCIGSQIPRHWAARETLRLWSVPRLQSCFLKVILPVVCHWKHAWCVCSMLCKIIPNNNGSG